MKKYIGDIYLITNVFGDEYDYVLAKSDEVVFKISNNKNGKRHKLQYSMLTNNKNAKFMSIKTNKF